MARVDRRALVVWCSTWNICAMIHKFGSEVDVTDIDVLGSATRPKWRLTRGF
jgi:hypothetical protein